MRGLEEYIFCSSSNMVVVQLLKEIPNQFGHKHQDNAESKVDLAENEMIRVSLEQGLVGYLCYSRVGRVRIEN